MSSHNILPCIMHIFTLACRRECVGSVPSEVTGQAKQQSLNLIGCECGICVVPQL